MTFFEQLQLPPVISCNVTTEEARQGLLFEVHTAMGFIHFVFSVLVLVSILLGLDPLFVQMPLLLLFAVWHVLLRTWGSGSNKARKLVSVLFDCEIILALLYSIDIFVKPYVPVPYRAIAHAVFVALFSFSTVNLSGFHPLIRLFIHVPLASPGVQTGLLLLATDYGLFKTIELSTLDEATVSGLRFVLAVFGVALVAVTAGLMAGTAMSHPRREIFRLYTPWRDVYESIRSLVMFRLMTGMKMSSFARLLDAGDPSEVLTLGLLEEWLDNDRGAAAYEFIIEWKAYRLGKCLDTNDEVHVKQQRRAARRDDSPLRSPLLRGY